MAAGGLIAGRTQIENAHRKLALWRFKSPYSGMLPFWQGGPQKRAIALIRPPGAVRLALAANRQYNAMRAGKSANSIRLALLLLFKFPTYLAG